MKYLLGHQVVWILLAVICNLYSLWRIENGQSGLSSTDPVVGLLVFVVFIPVVWLGFQRKLKSYLVLNSMFLVLIGYGGIALHLINLIWGAGLTEYASIYAFVVAVSVNVYGVTVSVLASRKCWLLHNARI